MSKVIAAQFRLQNNELVYDQTNILGTVSQTAGEPTGAIIERGNNSNGEYVKYADGTMLCWMTSAGAFGASSFTWTYPAQFTGLPLISCMSRRNDNFTPSTFQVKSGDSNGTSALIYATGNATSDASAVGRWY